MARPGGRPAADQVRRVAVGIRGHRSHGHRVSLGRPAVSRDAAPAAPGWCPPPPTGTTPPTTGPARRRRWPSRRRRRAKPPPPRRTASRRSTPVAGSIARPGGRPAADQVRVSPSGSEPSTARDTAGPSASVRLPGGWTSGGRLVSATTQENDTSSDRVRHPVVGGPHRHPVGRSGRGVVGDGARDHAGGRVDRQARRQARRRPGEPVPVGVRAGHRQRHRLPLRRRLRPGVGDCRRPVRVRSPSRRSASVSNRPPGSSTRTTTR